MAGKKGHGRPPLLPEPNPRPCEWCGMIFTPPRKRAQQRFCSVLCQRRWKCRPEANQALARRTASRRGKVMRGRGLSGGYVKFHQRHIHRVIAEAMLGRPLRSGEVVHHKNGNKRDNTPMNLEVLPSQAEHARLHGSQRKATRVNE